MGAIKRRISRRIAAASPRLAVASADFRPCFQFARRLRSKPSGVRGPVLGLYTKPLKRSDARATFSALSAYHSLSIAKPTSM